MSERIEPSDAVDSEAKTISNSDSAHGESEFAESPEVGEPESTGSPSANLHTGFTEKLRRTHPNPPVQEVGNLDDVRDHYQAYLIRGIEKMTGADDAEAWIDLTKGLIGAFMELPNAADETDEVELVQE